MKNREKLFTVNGKDPKQCRWEYFRAKGKGGQKKNKTESAARVTHIPSGAVGQATESRFQWKNRREAFKRMAKTEEFKKWHKMETARRTGQLADIEKAVEEAMKPKNLKVEGVEDGKWKELK